MSSPDPGPDPPAGDSGGAEGRRRVWDTSPGGAAGAADDDLPGRPSALVHPSLSPSGDAVGQSALGSLLGGLLVWGGAGMLLDALLETRPMYTIVGLVGGAVLGFYIVYLRFGRNGDPPDPTDPSDS